MGLGYLKIQAHTGDDAIPVKDAYVVIKDNSRRTLYQLRTDASGNTETVSLYAPDKYHTLDPNDPGPYYSTYEVDVFDSQRYITEIIYNVQIYDTIESTLPVNVIPMPERANNLFEAINIPPPAIQLPIQRYQLDPLPLTIREVIIPDYITVHLAAPSAPGSNVRVKFADYIKNVASSEIYATWPEASLRSNIYAQITFALNRVYTEWYRTRGFDFDITNSTSTDQAYAHGRNIYDNISKIVDEIFNQFVRRPGRAEPFFTQFCNGTTATCPGLSQWGTVTLANQGMSPIEILRYYYPSDVNIITSNNIAGITESYPGTPLREGSQGDDVRLMQRYLNRIRVNYPLIPQISNPNGTFDLDTTKAVSTFQNIFNLTADGVIGRDTWNKIVSYYVAVTKLASLESEGERIGIGEEPPNTVLRQGSSGEYVIELQFILNFISSFYSTVPPVIQDGRFGSATTTSVQAFQRTFNLAADGIVGPGTWNMLYNVYRGIEDNTEIPEQEITPPTTPPTTPPAVARPPFPGVLLRRGSRGDNVSLMQRYLNTISEEFSSIPKLAVDGIFGPITERAVREFQRIFGLAVDGIIGPITWNRIVTEYFNIVGT